MDEYNTKIPKDDVLEKGDEEAISSSDDSDDEANLEEGEALITKKIEDLQSTIASNPYLYQSHIDLINILSSEGELHELRKARETMSKYFPLSEDLWLSWIRDEIKVVSSPEDKELVLSLLERSFQDYSSVDLWLELIQFNLKELSGEDGINIVRKDIERAISAVGKHISKGSLIWDAYREIEYAILTSLEPASSVFALDLQEKIKNQSSRLKDLYKRQLSEPLLDMERTYDELKEWLGGEVPSDITEVYEIALGLLKRFSSFEESLLSSDNTHEIYQSYIAAVKKTNDFDRTLCLYERAISQNCLQPDLWLGYIQFLNESKAPATKILDVYKRAVRNCPWNAIIWDQYIKLMEENKNEHQSILDVVESALSVGFYTADDYRLIWLAYLDYLRRHLKSNDDENGLKELVAVFNRACEHLAESFGLEGDPNCEILRYWALIEASSCNQMDKARSLWNDIMSLGNDKFAHMWMEFISLEKTYGNTKHTRKVFQRALQHCQDYPELIIQSWLLFERLNGSLTEFTNCKSRCNERLVVIKENRLKQQVLERNYGKQKDKKEFEKKKFHSKGDFGKEKQDSDEPKKRKHDLEDISRSKKIKVDEKQNIDHSVIHKPDPSKDSKSIFVSNLDYTIDEESLKEFLKTSGEVVEIRLIKDYKGRSKGYAFVEMKGYEDVAACLKRDREHLNSRPVFISRCESDSELKSQSFRYSTNLEKNKLFIKGLPKTTTTEDLKRLFEQYGKLRDVRLVTYRNGHSKGLAYVEYFDELSASNALMKTDGSVVSDKTISVAISNPPQRKMSEQEKIASLGSGSHQGGLWNRKSKSKVDFLPRTLTKNTSKEVEATNGTTSKPMSNEDFKKMLLS